MIIIYDAVQSAMIQIRKVPLIFQNKGHSPYIKWQYQGPYVDSGDGNRLSLVSQFPSGDSVGGQILNMCDKESRPTLWRVDDYEESADSYIPTGVSVLESADSELESANSSAESNANASNVGVWVRAFTFTFTRS